MHDAELDGNRPQKVTMHVFRDDTSYEVEVLMPSHDDGTDAWLRFVIQEIHSEVALVHGK